MQVFVRNKRLDKLNASKFLTDPEVFLTHGTCSFTFLLHTTVSEKCFHLSYQELIDSIVLIIEPRHQKSCLRGFEISGLGRRGMISMYCLCSEYEGADQLRCYRAADLRLYFRICKK